jgi:hypothetical protein
MKIIFSSIFIITALFSQDADTASAEKKTFFGKVKSFFSIFGESEDSGMGVQFFHGEGIGKTRTFYLPGPEATFEITTYHGQGVMAPLSTYEVISDDGFGVVNGRFSIQSEFPLDVSWQKKKSSHEATTMIYNVSAGMYHLKVDSRLRWRIVVYPYRLN